MGMKKQSFMKHKLFSSRGTGREIVCLFLLRLAMTNGLARFLQVG
jgi:hypothetical protein